MPKLTQGSSAPGENKAPLTEKESSTHAYNMVRTDPRERKLESFLSPHRASKSNDTMNEKSPAPSARFVYGWSVQAAAEV